MGTREPTLSLPRTSTFLGVNREGWIQWAITLVTAALVISTLLPIVYQSLRDRALYDPGGVLTLANFAELLADTRFQRVIVSSLEFAALTTLISVALGTLMAIAVGRTDVPGRHVFNDVLLWPMYLSPMVVAFGWVLMYGPAGYVTTWARQALGLSWNLYTIPGMALAAAVSETPLAYLYCLNTIMVSDPSLEDAARISGARPVRVIRSVTLPLMRPPVLYSAVLIFTTSLELLSIPLILGNPVGIDFFASFIYTKGLLASRPDYGLIGAAAVVLLLAVFILVFLQGRLLGNTARFVMVRGKAYRGQIFRIGWLRWVAFALVLGYMLVGAVIPIAGLLARAFTTVLTPLVPPWSFLTMDNMRLVFSYPSYVRSIWNSLLISLVGASLTTGFVILVALVAHRSSFRHRRVLEFLALAPRAIPGIIIGIGFFWAMVLLPPFGYLRNTILALVISFGVRYIPSAYGAISPMLMRIGPELDQAARVMGADWWTAARRIVVPLLRGATFSSFVLLFVSFMKEYASAAFLVAPGSEIMGLTMLQLWLQGDVGPVAALSTVQVAIITAVVYVGRRVLGVRVYA
ncbi:ABC transporter permease [Limnochorda pilosa]|uniref:Membrane protein n=1 Tax=Limnochorda pilosa TaxID=1555112 RepID=A0A0K2SNA6_LIMPI|nr:iron ABC transporter permease [Limnochorda pilosa]BAS28595.1 membrane protein [Limnochorda pilosa]